MVHAFSASRARVVLLAVILGACGSGGGGGGGGGAGTGGTSGTGGATGGGGPCSPASCAPGQYCATCGARAGSCVERPVECHLWPEQIVCGCDGKQYRDPCAANSQGVEISTAGGCEQPPGTFPCGPEFCTRGTQYCQKWYSNNVPALTDPPYIHQYTCVDLAAGCDATPTCACVTRSECGACTVSADGDLTAMCQTSF